MTGFPTCTFPCPVTTRAPRPGEVDGVDYSFVTAERFQQLIDDGALLEWAEIHGGLHRSGTPAAPIREATEAGQPVLIEVDLAGARAVKQAMPEVITVFLAPPSWEALESRLSGRGTETAGGDGPPTGHRPCRVGRSGRLRRRRREQRVGVRLH